MKKSILSAILLAPMLIFAQPAIDWESSFGGAQFDATAAIHPTSDGGYISIGQARSTFGDVTGLHGQADYWVTKIDNLGALTWQKTYGGTLDDIGTSIRETSDGGFIMIGYSTSADGDVSNSKGEYDAWVVKTDNSGNIVWEVSLGGSSTEIGSDISETSDGGFIVAARSSSSDGDVTGSNGYFDAWIVKLTNTGAISWQKTYGGSDYDGATGIKQTADGGYFFSGFSNSADGDVSGNHGNFDYWCVKIDQVGNIIWEKSLGGSNEEEAYAMDVTADGEYLITGSAMSSDGDLTNNNGYFDFWTVKLSETGNLMHQISLGGDSDDDARSIRATTDGSFIVAGRTQSSNSGNVLGNHGSQDFWVVRVDSSFALQWQMCLGGSDADYANGMDILSDDGGEIILAGHASSADGDVSTQLGWGDYWIVKLSEPWLGMDEVDLNTHLYPNPTNHSLNLETKAPIEEVRIFTLSGSLVQVEKSAHFSVEQLNSGVYLVSVRTADGIANTRFVKE